MRSTVIKLSITVIILFLAAYFGYNKYLAKEPAISQSTIINTPDTTTPNNNLANRGEFDTAEQEHYRADDNAARKDSPEIATATDNAFLPCRTASRNLATFFAKLSDKEYIKAYELNKEVVDHIDELSIKLLDHPPIISLESGDLLSLLKNAAHFYRIIGAKNISFIKDIMLYENDRMEYITTSFYDWSLHYQNCQNAEISIQLPLEKLYEYSTFFLHTLGGQSYLFRRESRTRLLVKYYSLLIVDRAMRAGIDKYKQDITEDLEDTIDELTDRSDLTNQTLYIENLKNIKKRLSVHK